MKQVLLRLINREPSKFMDFIQHLKRHQNIGAHPILQKIKNMLVFSLEINFDLVSLRPRRGR